MGLIVIGLFVVMVAGLVLALMCDTRPLPYDGESACPHCGVVICGFCQGFDKGCSNAHKAGCPVWSRADA